MKMKHVGLVVSVIGAAVMVCIKHKGERYVKERISTEAEKTKTESYETAKDEYRKYKTILSDENQAFNDAMTDYDVDTNRDGRLSFIHDHAAKLIDDLEKSSDIPENKKLDELEKKRADALIASKKALGLDKEKAKMEGLIKAAKNKCNKQLDVLSHTGDDPDLMKIASTLREAAEKDRDNAIENATKTYSQIEAKYKLKVEEWDEKILNAKAAREEALAEGRRRIKEQMEDEIKKIEDERYNASTTILDSIIAARSPDDQQIVDRANANLKYIRTCDAESKKWADAEYSKVPSYEKYATYFKEKKIGAGLTCSILGMPVVGLAIIAVEYLNWIRKVLVAMHK